MDPNDGTVKKTVSAKNTKVGEIHDLEYVYGKLHLVGDAGYALIDPGAGQVIAQVKASKASTSSGYDSEDDYVYVYGDKALLVVDPNTGKMVTTYKYVKDSRWRIQGRQFIVLGEKAVTSYTF